MTQGFTPLVQFLLLLLLMGFAMASLQLWPSVYIALSNASVFVEYNTENNMTNSELCMDLVDTYKNITVLTRPLPLNESKGYLEFDCTYFLYAGNFSFRLTQTGYQGVLYRTYSWWSPILHIQWPTFHLGVDLANNHSFSAFKIAVSTNIDFQACQNSKTSSLYLEVSYLEHNQIGKYRIDKVQRRIRHDIQVVKSQYVELECASLLTEAGFIQVALKSHHTQQDIKSSGPLFLSRIFSYKLQVENIYKSGCEGMVTVRLLSPPCTITTGKVLLYKEGNTATEQASSSQLAFHFLTPGQDETAFNCSLFDFGRNKYCFHFAFMYSDSPGLAHTCIIVQRNAEIWGPWQMWSRCSVSCGEGVRERVRKCLLPPSAGMQCTGMVREQSLCSLEACTEVLPTASFPPTPTANSVLGANLVVVAGITLCLAVILVTILVTVWRKLWHTPNCCPTQNESMTSPSACKNLDEASKSKRSIQRPSFSESLQAAEKVLACPASLRAASDKGVLACQQTFSMSLPLPLDSERLSPSVQKILPPIFGYHLAQQQLKEMKKKGLKEATQVYHVSQSPIDDTMLEATASTSAGLTPVPQELEQQEKTEIHHICKSPFPEPTWPNQTSVTLPNRLNHKVDFILGKSKSLLSERDRRQERTADWVAMVERSKLSCSKNPHFRRTSSFDENNLHQLTKPRPFRERSMTQVAPRQLPEGSCRTRALDLPIPELEGLSKPFYKPPDSSSDNRRRPWVDIPPPISQLKTPVVYSRTSTPNKSRVTNTHGVVCAPRFGMNRGEKAEKNWKRRGSSSSQTNLLARKLRETNSSPTYQPQQNSIFSSTGQCRSLPMSADYRSSSFGLTEDEQRMMDISEYLGEEEGIKVMKDLRLT